MSYDGNRPADPIGCRVREVLDLIADKWSLYVVGYLGDGPRRFTELKRGIDGIGQRMLTVTLRVSSARASSTGPSTTSCPGTSPTN
jgi:DNA-binding HxlR family transcriptional regulator